MPPKRIAPTPVSAPTRANPAFAQPEDNSFGRMGVNQARRMREVVSKLALKHKATKDHPLDRPSSSISKKKTKKKCGPNKVKVKGHCRGKPHVYRRP